MKFLHTIRFISMSNSILPQIAMAPPKSALLLDYYWCLQILQHQKTWEIRSRACRNFGRIAVACTKRTSPTGECLILGEVDLTNCLTVGRLRSGMVVPPEETSNYMFLKANVKKHQIFKLRDFPKLFSYRTIYAWVLSNPTCYAAPKKLEVKKGCIVWVKIS